MVRRPPPGRVARSIAAPRSARGGGVESPPRPPLRSPRRPTSATTPVKRWPRVGWSGRSIAAVGRVRARRHHGRHRGQGEASRTGQFSAVLSSAMPILSTCAMSCRPRSSMQLYRPARTQQGRRSAVGNWAFHTHEHVQNLRVDRPLTRYPERGYELMGTGYSGNGMLRQRTTNRPQRTA